MKHPFKNIGWYGLVFGLVAALVILADLQYRSSQRLSDATSEQMRANLRASLMDMRRGVENELSPVCRDLQAEPWDSRQEELQQLAAGIAEWRRTAAHPNLVSRVLVWRPGSAGDLEVVQAGAGRDQLAPANWPVELQLLHTWLLRMSANLSGPAGDFSPDAEHPPPKGGFGLPPPPISRISSGWWIDEHIPALVHANIAAAGFHDDKPPQITWVIVQLDSGVLTRHILPELAQRYFGSGNGLIYRVAVLSGEEGQPPIYSSEPTLSPGFVPDGSLNLFGPLIFPDMKPGTQPFTPQPSPVRAELGSGQGSAGQPSQPSPSGPSSAFQPPGHNLPWRPPFEGMGTPEPPAGDHREPLVVRTIRYNLAERDWVIVAQHRKGSLEAAVSSLFYRNLAINFGVLLILALTTSLIIVASARARRLAQLQVDFVAGVSHELRTPLTGIVAAAQNLSDGLVESKEQLTRYGNAILAQAQQLSDLIEQILMFSAVDKGRQRYHLQPTDVAEVLNASLKNTASLGVSAGVTIEQEIAPDLPLVNADFKALSRCLDNLITNAIKYAGDRRWVRIRAFVDKSPESSKEVCISVEDRGIGIDSADLKQIFEPFYRSPEVTAAQIHGNGLGLPLANKVVEAMGGRLSVESAPAKGSKFTVHLPIKGEAPVGARVASEGDLREERR